MNTRISKLSPCLKVLLAVLAAVLFIALLLGINEPHFSPFSASLRLEGVRSGSNYANGCMLIDSDLRRMIFTDKDGRVVRIVNTDRADSPADRVFAAQIMNDRVYVIGCREINGGIYVSSESILEYDLSGNYLGEINRIDYKDDEYHSFPRYRDLGEMDGLLYLIGLDGDTVHVVVTDPSQKSVSDDNAKVFSEPLARISFYPEKNSVAAKSDAGNTYIWHIGDDEIKYPSTEDIRKFYQDAFGVDVYSVFKLSENIDLMTYVTIMADDPEQPRYLGCINPAGNALLVYDMRGGKVEEVTSLPLHPWLYLKNLFFWIAVVVFSALLLFGIVVLLRKVWSRRVRGMLIIAFVLLLMVGVLSWQQDQEIIQNQQDHITSVSDLIALQLSKHHSDELSGVRDKMSAHRKFSAEDSKTIEELSDEFNDIAISQQKENSFYARIYIVCSDGMIRTLTDTQHLNAAGESVRAFSDIEKELLGDGGVVRFEKDGVNQVYRSFRPVFDKNGKCVAIIEVGNYQGNLSSLLLRSLLTRMVALLAILVTAFIMYTTVKRFRGEVRKYHEQKRERVPTAGINLIGIYSFIYALSTRMDYIILPILSLKICQNIQMDAATTAFMAALPLTANGIGLWIGNILIVPLSRRLGEKKCAVLSQTLTILACLLEALFAFMSNIYLFTASKLLFGVFSSGIMYSFRRTIPLGAPDPEAQHAAIDSDNQAVISATVLSTLIGGFITQYISEHFVYLLAAAMSVPLLFVCFYVFTGKKETLHTGAKLEGSGAGVRRSQWGILTKPVIISLLCLVRFSKNFQFGYMSYLYPLYTNSAGLPTIIITSIGVLALTTSSIVNRAAENYLRDKDRSKTMIVVFMVTAVCMICFIFSPNIWWAIFTLFIVEIEERVTNTDVNICFAKEIAYYGYEPKPARAHIKLIEESLQAVTGPIMSVFVPLGNNFACAAVGMLCAVMLSVHTWLDRHFFRRRARPEG